MAIAKIIVDVPLMQTDQPYSYKVPEEFEEMLEVGMPGPSSPSVKAIV
ncbi:Helicase PriA essential for oriC/DnaA-independent DNA replication [Streptococcus oralis]|nr:Helicase PriA essential for oriC/DnaA-independent DNA replication [Streptococcus oralis]